jgi:EmrB/QacA subfamily drug resistance transporter
MSSASPTEPSGTFGKSTLVAILVAGAFFMENLDATVIATALPQMGKSFHVSPVDLNMGMTAYMLMLAVFIPISGWVADRYGTRTVFMCAIAVFTLSSIFCGMSTGLWQFTAARIIQGIGGAMMVPVGRLVVLRTTEKSNLMNAIAYITWPGLVAPVLGPPLGGFITTYASWHWIFFLNVPLGIVGMTLAWLWISNFKEERRKPFDWLGFALCGSACTTFMYGLELVGRESSSWRTPLVYVMCGLVLGALGVLHIRRAPHPVLDISSLKIKTFAVTIYGGSLFRIAISMSPFLLPLLFQVSFGLNAFQSGMFLLALFAGNLGMKTITSPILRMFGFRAVLLTNGMLNALVALGCAALSPQTAPFLICAILFFNGLFRSMQFTALNTLAFADVPKSMFSPATSLYSMITQMSMGMGVAVGAIFLRLGALVHHHSGVVPVLADFRFAFILVAIVIAAGTTDCFGLSADAGAEVSGHRTPSKVGDEALKA